MSTRYEEIPLTKIELHPNNIRVDVGDVTELAASIEAKGVLQPLLVAPHPTARTKFVVLAGHRRHAASKKAKLKVVPCTVREDLDTVQVQLEAMLVENLQRTDLNVVEEASAYQALMEFPDYDAKRIAKATGRGTRTVTDRLKLGRVDEKIKRKIIDHQVTLEQAMVFADFADDDAATRALTTSLGGYNWDYEVRRQRGIREAKAKVPKTVKQLEVDGATVIERPEGMQWAWKDYRPLYSHDEMSTAEHIAAKHVAVVDVESGGGPLWLIHKDDDHKEVSVPELTEEEKAEAEKRERIVAGLDIAYHVRSERIAEVLKKPSPGAAHNALVAHLTNAVNEEGWQRDKLLARFCNLLGLPEATDDTEVIEEIEKLTVDQAAILNLLLHDSREEELRMLHAWGKDNYWAEENADWRDVLEDVFEYKFSDVEVEALKFHTRDDEGGEDDAA